jgi:hypothetical protein
VNPVTEWVLVPRFPVREIVSVVVSVGSGHRIKALEDDSKFPLFLE